MLSYICTIFIPFYFAGFLQRNWCRTLYLYELSNEQFSFMTFRKLFLSRKIVWDKIYAIINVSLIIHYYNTQYVMIKWKTLTLSCNCPLVTSFLHIDRLCSELNFLPSLRVHIVFKYSKNNVVIYFTTYVCIYAKSIKYKVAYHIFYVKGTHTLLHIFIFFNFIQFSTILITSCYIIKSNILKFTDTIIFRIQLIFLILSQLMQFLIIVLKVRILQSFHSWLSTVMKDLIFHNCLFIQKFYSKDFDVEINPMLLLPLWQKFCANLVHKYFFLRSSSVVRIIKER